MKRRLAIWFMVLFAVAIASAWLLRIGVGEAASWTEDVLLSSGKIVTVKVLVIGSHPYGELGGPGGSRHEAYEIVFSGVPGDPHKWRGELGPPIILDRNRGGEWYVISAALSCDDVAKLGRKNGPYAEYRYRDGAWVRIPLASEHLNQKSSLMMLDERARGHYTVEHKAEIRKGQGPSGRYDSVLQISNSNC